MKSADGVKRRRLHLPPEKVDALVQHWLSNIESAPSPTLKHLASVVQDVDAAKAVGRHARKDEILQFCLSVLRREPDHTWLDALAAVTGLIVVPDVSLILWSTLLDVAECAGGGEAIVGSDEMPRLMRHLLNPPGGLEAQAHDVLSKQLSLLIELFDECAAALSDKVLGVDGIVHCLLSFVVGVWQVGDGGRHRMACINLLRLICANNQCADHVDSYLQSQTILYEALINIWIEGLTFPDVDWMAGQGFGNMLCFKKFMDCVLERDGVTSRLFSNIAYLLSRSEPGRSTRMAIFIIWQIVDRLVNQNEVSPDCLFAHPQVELIVAGIINCLHDVTEEDHEAYFILSVMLEHLPARKFVLAGSNVSKILEASGEVLSPTRVFPSEVVVACCDLLLALADCTEPSTILLSAPKTAPTVVGGLCRAEAGKKVLDRLIPALQWQPALVSDISLAYKRVWVSEQIRREQVQPGSSSLHIVVHRATLLEGLCDRLAQPTERLRRGLDVQFAGDGENGNGDGHRREFFKLAAEELTNADFGLFKSNDGGRSFHVSSTAADAQADNLAQFELCGKLVGLALLHRETLPSMRFSLALRKLILGGSPLVLDDLAAVDPVLFDGKVRYLQQSRYNDGPSPVSLADLGLTFEDVPQPDVFPDSKQELCAGGAKISVTEQSKAHYLSLFCDHRLQGALRPQLDAVLRGFGAMVPEDARLRIQRMISPAEFGLLLCGLEEIDVADWQAHSIRHETTTEGNWACFWKVVAGMSQQHRSELLEFATGSPTVPVGGFAALPGYWGSVHRFTVSPPRSAAAVATRAGLPTASTCFNTLYLPTYPGEMEMRAALIEAVAHRRSGFSERAVAQ